MVLYDAIVLGTGGVGSAAAFHLARAGARVLGLDRFRPPHERGSSHGQTRMIRQAHFEHPDYTPLVLRSYQLWNELQALSQRQLYCETGVLQVGPEDGVVVPGVLQAAEEYELQVEQLTAAEIERRWPLLRVPDKLVGVLEPRAGYLLAEPCVQAHLDVARQAGAEFRFDEEVIGWELGDPICVRTAAGELATKRLIVTAGAWAGPLLAELQLELTVRRKSLFWYSLAADRAEAASNLPGYLFELPDGVFYGFPSMDDRGLKVGEHSGGATVDDPLHMDRQVNVDEQAAIENFLQACLPDTTGSLNEHAVCMYTMTPDESFVVDRHPEHANVVFAAGLSGHGFKFTPVLGQALAELALEGGTVLPIGFLSLDRFCD